MRLAVIILSYNTRDLLRQAVASVLASAALTADQLTVDVVVVDNASHDGSPAMVAAEFPQVHLVVSDKNLGYTGGNNLGMAQLGFDTASRPNLRDLTPDRFLRELPDFVLLLNSDAEVVGDALWQMAHFLAEYPGAGACGAHLRYGSGAFQHGAFAFPNLFQVLLDFFPLIGLPGVHRLHNSLLFNGRYPDFLWEDTQPFPVDFVLGAAFMVRREVILQVGGLDDAFFMYCEEMDWCLRMEEADWLVFALPTAYVTHHEAQSSKQVRWPTYVQLWRSRFRFYTKHAHRYPSWYVRWVRALARVGWWHRKRMAHQRFANGAITGEQLAEELAAYALLQRL